MVIFEYVTKKKKKEKDKKQLCVKLWDRLSHLSLVDNQTGQPN